MDERERLVEIMNSHGLNAKQLSVRLGVSAGTISNIIGGRNRPSHEFLKSIALTFPQISRDWLFMGEGDMRKPGSETSTADSEPNLFTSLELSAESEVSNSIASSAISVPASLPQQAPQRTVQKILIFYSDGTYEER